MKQEALTSITQMYLPVIGLMIFLTIFLGVCFWVFRKDSKKVYNEAANLPFNKE